MTFVKEWLPECRKIDFGFIDRQHDFDTGIISVEQGDCCGK